MTGDAGRGIVPLGPNNPLYRDDEDSSLRSE